MPTPIATITFDAENAAQVGQFWANVTGYKLRVAEEDVAVLKDERTGLNMLFMRVPEGKTVKNRVHVETTTFDLPAEEARLIELGATKLRQHTENGTTWSVMADPEGNEFCVVLQEADNEVV